MSGDGGGYPIGAAGDDIPIAARFLAVADAFDAIVNMRPYDSRHPKQAAHRELRSGSGSQFDPEVVDVLLDLSV